MIATDLDGTLLRSDSTLSERTRAALRSARRAGIDVVVATARPARVIDQIFPDDGLIDLAICGNGAATYAPDIRRLTIVHAMPVDLARRTMATITDLIPGAGFAIEDGRRVLFEDGYRFRPTLDNDRVLVSSTAELLSGPIVKLMVALPDADPAAGWARLEPSLGPLVACTWSAPRAPLEIAARGVSKAAALAEVCAGRQIGTADVVAFGDSVNDLSMLAWAGMPYAVANADPSVLAATPHHTGSNDADGVAAAIEALLDLDTGEHALS
ncbi:MAG TPA: HAD hydrolase family protein [Micromonosporaceae bacterium]